jgi:hypothetical protein
VEQFQLRSVSHGLLQRIQRTPRNRLNDCLRDYP